jgi:hypothetical protein
MKLTKSEREFALEEWKTLRAEIAKKMDNHYKILSLGVGGITVLFGLGFNYKVNQLFLVLPFLIIANNYLYIAETTAIINAGNYLKKLESILYSDRSEKLGWENNIDRFVYKPFDYISIIIFMSLFCISFIKGLFFILHRLNQTVVYSFDNFLYFTALCFYCIIPFVFYSFVIHYYFKLWKNMKESSSSRKK